MLHGLSLLGGRSGSPGSTHFRAIDPSTGAALEPAFYDASLDDVRLAGEQAAEAAPSFGRTSGAERAAFLRRIAEEIEALGEPLLQRFTQESGLPAARAAGERGRTCGQLRLFADLVAEGSWVDARIDRGNPDRKPLPKPDTRSMLVPIGPVAVFGPANFPLAFTVAGGDTASAFAAGCPVVVKAHPSHPGTSEFVGHAIRRAIDACRLHPGVFSLLFGSGRELGAALVQLPQIRAVGFTGSRSAGGQLYALCAARPVPIPFFGELSSINPVFLLPEALATRAEGIAEALHASATLGTGQFCTNPGLVLYVADQHADRFVSKFLSLMKTTAAGVMLNAGTQKSYLEGLARVSSTKGVETLVAPVAVEGCRGAAGVFRTTAAFFLSNTALHEEVFGPATLLVACRNLAEMAQLTRHLEGQLTSTLHEDGADLENARTAGLLQVAQERCGRLVFNSMPTGVEVCASMVHSGPWPATTDSRFTSVGTGAIRRWVRPICWQSTPPAVLPPELRDPNPLGILRMVDNQFTRDPIR